MKSKIVWFELGLLFAPFLAIALLWHELPPRIPTHWNMAGAIDAWNSRPWILMVPLISLALVAFLHWLPQLDPKLRDSLRESDRMHSVLTILAVAFAAFFDAILTMQITAALGHPILAARMVEIGMLILFAILGNYLGNLRPNYFAGIRTPWTLESAETWRATHRLGGRLMFCGALLLLALEFFVSTRVFAFVFVTLILAFALWSLVYSWQHFRRLAANGAGQAEIAEQTTR